MYPVWKAHVIRYRTSQVRSGTHREEALAIDGRVLVDDPNGYLAGSNVDGAAGRRRAFTDRRRLRVLVVDHEEIVHLGFRMLLAEQPWVERCLVATRADEARELARRYEPHVALVELMLGADSGVQLCEGLKADCPGIRMLLLTGDTAVSPQTARCAGAVGVVAKAWLAHDLATAVRMVGMGMTLFTDHLYPDTRFSQRERDVIGMIAGGATNREIAARLYLSPNTVKQHASALYRKLEARNRAEAVRRAQRLGLIA